MEIIQNIISIMSKKEITAYQMEKDDIIKASTFLSWKKGAQPPADKLFKVMRYLEVSPNELFGYPDTQLSENEMELLKLFNQLPEREQIKFIGRLEDAVEKYGKDNN